MAERGVRLRFLVRSLGRGGAERQVVTVAKGLAAAGFDAGVVTFYRGALDAELVEAGIAVTCVGKRGRWDVAGFLTRLVRTLRRDAPTILYGVLPMPNLLALAVRPLIGRPKVVWGVRAAARDESEYDWLWRAERRWEARLAQRADLVVVNSEVGRREAVARGFPSRRTVTVLNGVDTARFRIDRRAGDALRGTWLTSGADVLVGVVGRLDPVKDHAGFLQAAEALRGHDPAVAFAVVGGGDSGQQRRLEDLVSTRHLTAVVVLAGDQDDMSAVYNALDLVVSSSRSEGFPNVLAEAMACGVPCVATDVGDSADIVADTGWIVAPGDPKALAAAMADAVAAVRSGSIESERLRASVAARFSAEDLAARTIAALEGVAGPCAV